MTTVNPKPDLILTGRWIVQDCKTPVLSNHGIAITEGKITDVAPLTELKENYADVEVVGDDGYALMPGFVNAHHHSFGVGSILRGVKDQVLEPWIIEMSGAPSLPKGLAAKLTAASLLRSGVTTTVDMCGGVGTLEEFTDGVDVIASGYRESGIRTILAPGMRAQNLLSQADGEDDLFLKALPDDLHSLAQAMVRRQRPAVREYIASVKELISNFNDQSKIEIWFGPPGPQWCGMEAFAEISQAAVDSDTRIQTHALESFSERLEGRRSFDQSRIIALARESLLSDRLSLAHMVWASDEDIEVVGQHGVSICHNPSSNLRLRAGIAPLPEFMTANITVGLGLDGTSLNDDDDMFTELRLVAGLQNARVDGSVGVALRDAYGLATTGSAKLIGQSGIAGEISVGAAADFILVELDRLEWPWADPDLDPLDLILARAQREDIAHVMVDGTWSLWNRQLVDLDLKELGSEAAECLSRTLPSADRRAQTRALAEAVQKWHEAWEQNDLEGRAVYNSPH